ncbi:hypothetical protein ACWIGW_16835 [Nocardia brasiliensis]
MKRADPIYVILDDQASRKDALCIIDADNLRAASARSRNIRRAAEGSAVVCLLRLQVETPSAYPVASSIPVFDDPAMLASLIYDAWLLDIANGAVVSGGTDELRQQVCKLLRARGCDVHTTVSETSGCIDQGASTRTVLSS